jgi:hypothetical protein
MKVKAFTKSVLSTPKRFWAIIMWPVDDTGRNSVNPSTMAMMMVSNAVIPYFLPRNIIANIINTKPTKHTSGATTMRRVLKMSGSKCVSVELGPVIKSRPAMIMITPTAMRM